MWACCKGRLHLHSQRTESHIHPAKKNLDSLFLRVIYKPNDQINFRIFLPVFKTKKIFFTWPLILMTRVTKVNFLGVSFFHDQRQPKSKSGIFRGCLFL